MLVFINACRLLSALLSLWEVVSCRDFILRTVATFWAMSLVGIYPGKASTVQEKLNSFDCMLFPTVLYANATGTVVYQYIFISNGPIMNKIWTKM